MRCNVLKPWLRACLASAVLIAAGLSGAATAQAAPVAVDGAVATPATYSITQLQALTQTSLVVPRSPLRSRTTTYTGVLLRDLVLAAQPVLPVGPRNPSLRLTITVQGSHGGGVTVTLGELDPFFGNHPAILALTQDGRALGGNGPELVLDDSLALRRIDRIDRITVSVQNPTPTIPPSAGAVTVRDGARSTVLTAQRLAALPARTLTVNFLTGTTPTTRTETGPRLDRVLVAAGINPLAVAWVAGVAGSDGYVATVTPAEDWVGGRELMLSLVEDGATLVQPRLIAGGDVRGGRYVTGVTDLVVGRAPLWWFLSAAGFTAPA
jgi:hypothetical protein